MNGHVPPVSHVGGQNIIVEAIAHISHIDFTRLPSLVILHKDGSIVPNPVGIEHGILKVKANAAVLVVVFVFVVVVVVVIMQIDTGRDPAVHPLVKFGRRRRAFLHQPARHCGRRTMSGTRPPAEGPGKSCECATQTGDHAT